MKKRIYAYHSDKRSALIRRVIACLLVLLLLVVATPLALPVATAQTTAYVQPAPPVGGDCGSAVTWRYDPDAGTLTVSGTGTMQDYNAVKFAGTGQSVTTAPWRPFHHEIQTVLIGEGVTSIGNAAFVGCDSLTRVTIANSVTRIGASAFSSCTALPTIAMPPGVTTVDRFAFSGCTGLTSVQIRDLAAWCRTAFTGVAANPLSCAHRLILNGEPLTELTIPDGVTSIGNYKFYGCEDLTRVTIPPSVTSIGHYAFMGCTGLTELALPDSVTSIGQNAFSDCTGLTDVSLGAGVTSIAKLSFSGCTGLTAVPAGSSVTSIANEAFADCTGLTAINVPDGVVSIGNEAFSGCAGAESISIPASVTAIEAEAFSGCVSVSAITVAAENPVFHSAGNCIIQTARKDLKIGCRSSVIPADGSVTRIGYKAFANCASLTGITIPENITEIYNYAFAGCTGLTELTIPESVTDVGGAAFYNCTGLTDVRIPDSVTALSGFVFAGCTGLTSVTIPDSVTTIGSSAFSGCTGLTDISIPDSVTSIGAAAFRGCTGLTTVSMPESVTAIGESAFRECAGLTSAWMPESVTSIGDFAFCDCTALTEMTMPGSITAIGKEVFCGCAALTRVSVPDSVQSIGDGAFRDCAALTAVTLPDRVASIGEGAFLGCAALTSVAIPAGVTSIGNAAFGGCNALTSLTVAEGNPVYHSAGNCVIHTKDKLLIQGCRASVIPADGSVKTLGVRSFYYIASLTSIYFPAGVQTIGGSAFCGCTGLTGFTFSEDVGSVWFGDYVFYGCTALTQVRLPHGAWSSSGFGKYIFADCTALTSVVFGNRPDRIWAHAFENCTSLTSVTLPDTVKTIEKSAFRGCTGLTGVSIPAGVTLIEEGAFFGCGALTNVAYGGTGRKWNAITIRESNDPLFSAAVQCNETPYTVVYLVKDEIYQSYTCYAGDRIPEPEEPIVAGYIFEDWSPAVPLTMPENDLTFTAVFEPITYYATFLADGIQVGEKMPYTVETVGITPPAVPEKPGYIGAWERFTPAVGGVTIHAIYTKIQPPTIYINHYSEVITVGYHSTVTFSATATNAPDGAEIVWFVNSVEVGTGKSYTVEKATSDFSVQCRLIGCDGSVLANSGIETVKVNTSFFAKLIAFFKQLFGRLAIITQSFYFGG